MTVVSLDARRAQTIGGSEAAAACGLDPYRSRVMLWAEKTGRIEREPTEAMRWGTLLEPVVFAELERRGYELVPAPAEGFQDEKRPWLTGHPDGFAELDGWPAILEVKTAGAWAGREWSEEAGAPLPYLLQCHHYLELTGYPTALLACLVGGQRLETRVVQRDDAVIARMLELEAEFLEYVKRDEPPPPDGSDSAKDALAALYPESTAGEVVRLDRSGWADYKALKARKEQRDEIDRQVKELQQRIEARMGTAERAISPYDDEVATWTLEVHHRFDTAAFRKANAALAETYTVTSPRRVFRLK